MFEVLNKQILAQDVKRIDVIAPTIAEKVQPGQFVSVSPEEGDERIPLSVIDADSAKGSISLIFQEVGETTGKLGSLPINESIFSILGPLGKPATIEKHGVVVCIATGVGAAQMLPICRALKEVGNKVIGVVGAKTKRALLLEAQMRLACDRIYVTTNDGSYERRGLATEVLSEILEQKDVRFVYAIGSADMMESVCTITRPKKIKTLVHLNPVMVDCMGMCGSCRVKVNGQTVLACTEGPEFDGHQVDFEDYKIRIKAFEDIHEWDSHEWPASQKKKESKTLTKFLSDILKS